MCEHQHKASKSNHVISTLKVVSLIFITGYRFHGNFMHVFWKTLRTSSWHSQYDMDGWLLKWIHQDKSSSVSILLCVQNVWMKVSVFKSILSLNCTASNRDFLRSVYTGKLACEDRTFVIWLALALQNLWGSKCIFTCHPMVNHSAYLRVIYI